MIDEAATVDAARTDAGEPLPPGVEALVAARDRELEVQSERIRELRRVNLRRDARNGALLLALANVGVAGFGLELVVVALAGAAIGLGWTLLDLGIVGVAASAGGAQALLASTLLSGRSDTVIALLFGTAFAALAGSAVGHFRETRAYL